MSALCAVAGRNLKSDELIEAMLGCMAHYPWLKPARHADPAAGVALGLVLVDGRAGGLSAVASPPDVVAAFCGEVFNEQEERQRLVQQGVSVADGSIAALVASGWRVEGAAFFARLNGEFTAAIWDPAREVLHVVTDRFGLRPLYVAQPNGALVVASEIKAVLAVPGVDTSWSETGVAEFFSFGHFFGDSTLLAGVRALPPATCGTYRVRDARYEETTYWRSSTAAFPGSATDAVSELTSRFATAVERRARPGEKLGLSLSGGLDARTILGVMPAGADLTTVSLGIEGSLDHRSAAELARRAGVTHHQYVLDAGFLSSFEVHLADMVRLTDGHYLDQGIVMPTLPVYRDLGIEYLMRGHAGELLHMTKAYAYSLDRTALGAGESALKGWLFTRLSGYMLDAVPSDLFTIDLRALAEASLSRALARCQPGREPVDVVWQLFLNERIHRETALAMHPFGCFATVRQPYLDNDVVDLLLAMPAAMKLGDDLQTEMLRARRPDFLRVVNSNTGARMGAGRLENALARVRLKVGAKLGLKGYQPYERLGLWLRRELRDLVRHTLLTGEVEASGLVRADALKRIVDRHLAGEANHTFIIMGLLIFALGQSIRAERR